MPSQSSKALSVTELNREAKYLLESSFPLILVEGEISNLAQPASGHIYFSLKDERAQVRCAMFRNRNIRIKFRPANGQKVTIQARVSLFEGRGEFQLIVEEMQEAGIGDLYKKFEHLKQRLAQEGLFTEEKKQPIPKFPTTIGIVTSPTGAAIRDILSVLNRRYPLANILIYPTLVQGETAAAEICKAISKADSDNQCDVIVITRGGGSIEDLWPFNEEKVARKIFSCKTPIVSGVGHEVDFTISDFVADLRAPTPSAAAELITPDINELTYKVDCLEIKLRQLVEGLIYIHQNKIELMKQRLDKQKPVNKIIQDKQHVNHLTHKLNSLVNSKISNAKQSVSIYHEKLKSHSPIIKIENHNNTINALDSKLKSLISNDIKLRLEKVKFLARNLNAVSPLQTIARGYSVLESSDNHVISSTKQVKANDLISAKVSDGCLECQVIKINNK